MTGADGRESGSRTDLLLRAGRVVLILVVILFLAAPAVVAEDAPRSRPALVHLIKGPVNALNEMALAQARLKHHVTSSLLHLGVDLLSASVRKLGTKQSPEETSALGVLSLQEL